MLMSEPVMLENCFQASSELNCCYYHLWERWNSLTFCSDPCVYKHTHTITCPLQGDKVAVRLVDLSSYKLEIPQQHGSWKTLWNSIESRERSRKQETLSSSYRFLSLSWMNYMNASILLLWYCELCSYKHQAREVTVDYIRGCLSTLIKTNMQK